MYRELWYNLEDLEEKRKRFMLGLSEVEGRWCERVCPIEICKRCPEPRTLVRTEERERERDIWMLWFVPNDASIAHRGISWRGNQANQC
jgi:hypothetical protein